MKFIIAEKKQMTQIFSEDGNVIPVTVVKARPCPVVAIKKEDEKDGYNAIMIGMEGKKKLRRREIGQTRGLGNLQFYKEFKSEIPEGCKVGDNVSVELFEEGDVLKVIGTSKGKGFQGVVRRHGFHGQRAAHGNKDQERAPGSIGATEPARVFPGTRMAGHMGNAQVTVKNLKVVKIDSENNELYIKGAVPGSKGGILYLMADGELKLNLKSSNDSTDKEKEVESESEETKEDVKKEEKIEDKAEEVKKDKVEESKKEAKVEEVKEDKKEEKNEVKEETK